MTPFVVCRPATLVRRFAACLSLVLSLLAFSATVAAQPEPSDVDRATARALAREGYEAQQRGQYGLAADRFGRADALVHAPTLLLGLARAQQGLGELVEAYETYQRLIREPLPTDAPPAFVKAVEDAKREAPAVAARLAWVTLVVRGPSVQGPTAARITVDAVSVSKAAIGVRRACNPGTHVARAFAPGFRSTERSFVVTEGGAETIVLDLPREAAAPTLTGPETAAPTLAGPVAASAAPASSWHTPVGIIALSAGAAGLIVGAVTGALALGQHASLSSECPDGRCSTAHAGEVDTYRNLADVATVATLAGAAAAAAGVVLLLTPPASPHQPVGVYVGPLAAGITGRF
jgi:hypothetical protein